MSGHGSPSDRVPPTGKTSVRSPQPVTACPDTTVRLSGSLSLGENDTLPRMPESFQIAGRAGTNPSVHIVSVRGAITYSNAPALQEASGAAGAKGLVLDLSEVPSVDSIAVGALVRVLVSCSKSGRKLALVGPNHRIRNVLQLTGVDPLFDIFATIPEAESALS